MAEDLPEDFVERAVEFEQIIGHLLSESREEPVAITAALRGVGGYGKTTLARAVCHDRRILDAFDDGVLWVTLGERYILDCVMNRDSTLIAVASRDATLGMWDAQTGNLLRGFMGHTDPVYGCTFSPDGNMLLSGGWDRTVRVWRVSTGKCVATLHLDGFVRRCKWYPDGRRIVIAGDMGIYFLRLVL